MSIQKLWFPCTYTASAADIIRSSNYPLQSPRKRKKSQRSDAEKRLLFAVWLALESWSPINAPFVYSCKLWQCYARLERIRSIRTILCAIAH